MNRLAIFGIVALAGTMLAPATTIAQTSHVIEEASDDSPGITYLSDEDWCDLLTPTDDAKDFCIAFIEATDGIAILPVSMLPALDLDADAATRSFDSEPEATPESMPAASPGPVTEAVEPKLQLIKGADFKRTVKAAGSPTFTGKSFFEKTLRVWVNGERLSDADYWVTNANKGKFSVYGLEAGDIVQAKYDRKKKVTHRKTVSGNGSDDFFLTLPKRVSYPDKVRFTVRSDSPYGCSAYVYVWDGDYWESQRPLSMSFDGYRKKSRQMGWANDFGTKDRVWVNTNCPWTLTFLNDGWVKA